VLIDAQWEDPDIVPLEKCCYDMPLRHRTRGPGLRAVEVGIGHTNFPPIRVAELDICGTIDLAPL
jgi:hypothetical protein